MVLEFKSFFVLFVSNGNKEKKTCWSFYHSQVFFSVKTVEHWVTNAVFICSLHPSIQFDRFQFDKKLK